MSGWGRATWSSGTWGRNYFADTLSEATATGDTMVGTLSMSATVSESSATGDTMSGLFTLCSGVVTETITTSDSYDYRFEFTLTESVAVSDDMAGYLTISPTITENPTIAVSYAPYGRWGGDPTVPGSWSPNSPPTTTWTRASDPSTSWN